VGGENTAMRLLSNRHTPHPMNVNGILTFGTSAARRTLDDTTTSQRFGSSQVKRTALENRYNLLSLNASMAFEERSAVIHERPAQITPYVRSAPLSDILNP